MKHEVEQQFEHVFKALPAEILLISVDDFKILSATTSYLQNRMLNEIDIIDKTLIALWSSIRIASLDEHLKNLMASVHRTKLLKKADVIRIPFKKIRHADGRIERKEWLIEHSPVMNDDGAVTAILHRIETSSYISTTTINTDTSKMGDPTDFSAYQDEHLTVKARKKLLNKLTAYDGRVRTVERLFGLGAWELHTDTGQLFWSQQVLDIYAIPAQHAVTSLESFFKLLHPQDSEHAMDSYQAFMTNQTSKLEFTHRLISADGAVRYINIVGERKESADEIITGYVHDITSLIRTRRQLSLAEKLLQLAGEKAQLGGWRVELATNTIFWTAETAAIHDMPLGYSPANLTEGIQFYKEDYQTIISQVVNRCIETGEEFDVICRLQTPKGRCPWVRVIGVAECDEKGKVIALQGAFQDITALHETKQLVVAAEKSRLNVLESISDAFFALDESWRFTYANQQACELLESSSELLIGQNIWRVFPEANGSQFQLEYQRAVIEGQTRRFQAYYAPLHKWFDVSAFPFDGGLTVYFRDVTQELEDQQLLRLVDAALARQNDIVVITTADSINQPTGPSIVYVNDAFEHITGYSKQEVIGLTPRILQGPDTDKKQLARIRAALEEKKPIRCELLNYTKKGKPYWLEIEITPLFDDARICTHFVAVERDISKRKRQEAELSLAKERFELMSKATNDVIWDWDIINNKVWWNNAVTDVFGYTLDQLEPSLESWTNRIHSDDLDMVLNDLFSVIEGSVSKWIEEYRFRRVNGTYANVIDRGFVIRDKNGKATRMVGSIIDITQRMDLEQRLRESQKLEALGHLTGGVAHDFNNLLTVILGNVEVLSDSITDAKMRPILDLTLRATERGAELTSRLLAFARRKPLNPKPTDINRLVADMRGLIRRTLPEHIELKLIPAADLGIVEVDAGELDTALLNLVVNARDSMQAGGKLTIETTNVSLSHDYAKRYPGLVAGEYVKVTVSDNGQGMTPETINRAFEPFFTTKDVGKGSGLGLSMVFGFTKQSGGHINIDSELGKGTTVKLYFPRLEGLEHIDYHTEAKSPIQGGSEHILITEDDAMVLQYLERQLCSLGYLVTSVTCGEDALSALAADSDIQLLLTDIIMPGGMNGQQLAERAKALYPELKVLYTSGYTDNAIVHHERLEAGIELLSKPYTRQVLAKKLRKVLDN